MSTSVAASIDEQFGQLSSSFEGRPDGLAERRAALERFAELGFPTRKLEQWRYTDIAALRDGSFELAPPIPGDDVIDRARTLLAAADIGPAACRCVFIDGHLVPQLSDLEAEPGVELLDLADRTAAARPAATTDVPADQALVALNAAFARTGVAIRVAGDKEIDEPVLLLFVGARNDVAPQVRVAIEMASGSGARVVQHFVDLDDAGPGWINIVTEIRQDSGSRLELYRLQEHRAGHYQTALIRASVGRDATFVAGGFDIGGALVRNDYDIVLAEPGSRTDLFGIALAAAGQHVDNHVAVDHRAPHTESSETFRSIVGEHGRAVFNGKVIVREGAQKIDARQRSDNLLLSERAEVDTRPELEIYADDVKCSHGATVGELDEGQLFYLRARGIDEKGARALLTYAFANTLIDRIELPRLAGRVAARIANGLPEAPNMDIFA